MLAGHSMGAHTAVAYALRHPERVAGLVVIGPVYDGEHRGRVARLLGRPRRRRWRRAASTASSTTSTAMQGIDPAWRDSVLRFTRERMLRHRHLDAVVEALREVPRSRPFESLEELEALEVPTLVVASHDAADPGHPYDVAARLRRAAAAGAADQRGRGPVAARLAGRPALARDRRLLRRVVERLSFVHEPQFAIAFRRMKAPAEGTLRRIATFLATVGVGVATYIAIADSGGGSAGLPGRRPAAARRSPTAPTRTCSASTSRSSASSATCCCSAAALLRGDGARMGGFARRPGRLRLQRLPDLPGAVRDRRDLPVVRRQRGPDDGALRRQRDPHGWLRRETGMSGQDRERRAAKSGCGRRARRGRGAPQAAAPARQRRGLPGDRRRRRC